MDDELMEKVIFPESGRYVVAVSGGVDSMSVLHMLAEQDGYELIVAHCNHGLRSDAEKDEKLVREAADHYGLEVRTARLQLEEASEDAARRTRYDFLYAVYEEENADGIITAHHLDDRIETMLLNKQRGAGWIGLSPLHETEVIKRPLLGVTKRELREYAEKHNLTWREDPTNRDPSFTPRNRIRQQLSDAQREQLYKQLREYDEQRRIREQYIDTVLKKTVVYADNRVHIDRTQLRIHDVATARDVLYMVLKTYFQDYLEVDFDAVVRLEHFYKTAKSGKRLPLSRRVWAHMEPDAMVVFVTSASAPCPPSR